MSNKLFLVTDPDADSEELKSALRKYFIVKEHPLMSNGDSDLTGFPAMLVDLDLKDRAKVEYFREMFPDANNKDCVRLFVVDRGCRADDVQSANLRARETITRPIDFKKLHRTLCGSSNKYRHLLHEKPSISLEISQEGIECLQVISQAVQDGETISKSNVSRSAQKICDAVAKGKILEWLTAVNNHHSYSYRHSLHVAGLMIAFADHLKFNESDKSKMVIGALMHDLGKSKLPLQLLDKEGPLTPEEQTIFRSHPLLGYEILKNDGQWDQMTIDMVFQHHEFLDGTGYPYGLSGKTISDPVRMLTIVDIFSALVDKRAYKDGLSPEKAMQLLYSMGSKLDMAIVQVFEPIGMKVIDDIKELEIAA